MPESATIDLRVPPADLQKIMDKHVQPSRQITSTEDMKSIETYVRASKAFAVLNLNPVPIHRATQALVQDYLSSMWREHLSSQSRRCGDRWSLCILAKHTL